MTTEWERSLNIKTAVLLDEYQKIVQEFFPGVITLEEFKKLFCEVFTKGQSHNTKKMDPDSLRERNISCSPAGALLGVWWIMQFPQLVPIFLIEETSLYKTGAHVNVALPTKQPISPSEATAAFADSTRSRKDIALVDWTTNSNLKDSNPAKSYSVYPIAGVDKYIANRIRVFGLPKKYSSKNL